MNKKPFPISILLQHVRDLSIIQIWMTKIPTVKTGGGGGIFLMGDADAKENGPRFSLNSLAKLRKLNFCSAAGSADVW